MPPTKHSFGARLFGAIPADDCAEPDQQAPETWLALFVEHADAAVWRGLFTGSAACRDFTLQRASKCTLLLDCCGPGQPPQYDRLGQALGKRGDDQQTAVRMRLDPVSPQPAEAGLCAFLAHFGAGISELHIDWYTELRTRQPSQWPYFGPSLLPQPPQLSKLRSISMSFTSPYRTYILEAKQASVAGQLSVFLPQVSSLQLNWGCGADMTSFLFTPGINAPFLTHLTTDAVLNDQLLRVLMGRAPNLTHLTVRRVGRRAGHAGATLHVYSDKCWTVSDLCVTECGDLGLLAGLPRCSTGKVRLTGNEYSSVATAQGLDPAVLECLPDWQFDNTRVVIRLDSNLTPTDQVTALRTTLQQLQAMQKAPGSAGVVELAGLPETPAGWRPGLIGMLCAAVPDLPHLHLSVRRSSNISDQVLGGLVQTGQGVRYVSACDLSLASEQHAGAQWPWRELRFSGVLHVPGLVRVPRPSGQGGPSVVGCNDLMFQGVAEQAVVDRLKHWCQHVLFAPRTWQGEVCIHVCKPKNCKDQVQALSMQLALMQAVRLQPGTRVEVRFSGWRLTESIVQALQGLPAWAGTLHFHNCRWPDTPDSCVELLPACVPATYTHWQTEADGMPASVLSALRASLRAHRQALCLPPVALSALVVGRIKADSETDSEE